MASHTNYRTLLNSIQRDDRLSLAKALTLLENGGKAALQLMHEIPIAKHRSHTIGITGAPGVGKSTMINALIKWYRQQHQRLAVLAIDPTSPFSGGAILGDRIRMVEHGGDTKVFIRSLGSRGNPAGLSMAIPSIIELLELWGADIVLIETVGSGQLDVLIKTFVDTTMLLLSPEGGDEVQMMKAGILEIADLMVINKADRPGVEHLENQLQLWLDLLPKDRKFRPQVIRAEATHDRGMDKIADALKQHYDLLRSQQQILNHPQHIKFLALNLAVSMFRSECLELLDKMPVTKEARKHAHSSIIMAQQLLKDFAKKSR